MSESFNYIAFGYQGYVEGAVGTIGMSRGRMFEYTPTDIEKRLEDLGPTSIEYLEKLPTFLCSEISDLGGAASMVVKYGSIESTTAGKKDVSTTFKTLMDFGNVEFANVEQARELFGADRLQLYRTHWARLIGMSQRSAAAALRCRRHPAAYRRRSSCGERCGVTSWFPFADFPGR